MHSYSKNDLSGKEKAKKKICHSNNIPIDQPLFFSGSLIEDYDLSKVLEGIEGKKDIKLFLVGKPNSCSIEKIKTLKESGH